MCFIFISHSAETCLDCFHFLGVVTTMAVSMTEKLPVETDVESFGHRSRNDIAGAYRRFAFSYLRFCHVDFHNGFTSLQSHQQWIRCPFFLHPQLHLLLVALFSLSRVSQNIKVVLLCIILFVRIQKHALKHFFISFF